MELYKDESIPTNPRIVFKVKALAGEVSTDFVILLKINKTLTRHTFTVGDNIEYQLSDTEQIFTDGERFKFAIGQEDTRLIGNLSDIDVDTDTIEGKLDTANANININTDKLTISENREIELGTAISGVKADTETIKEEFNDDSSARFDMTIGQLPGSTIFGFIGFVPVGSISGKTTLQYKGNTFTLTIFGITTNDEISHSYFNP